MERAAAQLRKIAIGGWQMNTLAFWQSGVPFSVLDYVSPVPSNVSGLVTNDRPNAVSGQPYAPANQNYQNWINVNAFTPQITASNVAFNPRQFQLALKLIF